MKIKRQSKILEIIQSNRIETQEELSERLKSTGFQTTQATISRDIKDLNIIKINSSDGKSYYSVPSLGMEAETNQRLEKIFKEGLITIDSAENIVVIKTLPALASAACSAIDSMKNSNILGSLAGDDTGILIMKSKETAEEFVLKIRNIMV